jgi:putative NADH-flavin reductase
MRRAFMGNLVRATLVAGLAIFAGAASAETARSNAKPLNILVIGASGMVGSRITAEAASRGHHVTAAARHPDKIKASPNVKAVKLDATDAAALTAAAKDVDVIVSATSPRGGGDPIQEAKAVGDAVIAAAKATGKRLFVVGGAGSLKTPDGRAVAETLPAAYRGEALGMRGVLESLKTSGTNWTFFSPAMSISPGKKTGQYRLGTDTVIVNDKGDSKISAEDYAKAAIDELESPWYQRSQMTIGY